ncbi:hypothetical protein KVT40_001350 [Elsinoe batatas]|uniref:Uncharacterized protein n=1 Tax=Elsinoe batatas TaxID=2601811 RepID=A0A8K0PH76_9PEZI|nr:hypothetical protein KVT40_001350 [Elsinoe batatas]
MWRGLGPQTYCPWPIRLASRFPTSGIRPQSLAVLASASPLSFNSDGSAKPLNCQADAKFSVPYTPGKVAVTGGAVQAAVDATPADATYKAVCDSDQWDLFQTWRASKDGNLKSVSINVARGVQTVPLSLTVFNNFTSYTQLTQPLFKYNTLGAATFTPANLTYTFDTATVTLIKPVQVKKGDFLGLAIAGSDYSPYCHLEYDSSRSDFKLFQRGAGQNSYRGTNGKKGIVYERVGKSVKFFASYA